MTANTPTALMRDKEKPREFLSATSLTGEEFETLLPSFEKCYQLFSPKKTKLTKKKKQRRSGGGRKSTFESLSDKLLFILIYQKTFPLSNDARLTIWLESNSDKLLDSSLVADFADEFE